MMSQTYRLLSNNQFLHFLNLGHMIFISPKLPFANTLVYPH